MQSATDISASPMLPARLSRGFEVGDYVVDGWVRDGGMAAIYRAVRVEDEQRVALKLQLPSTVHLPEICGRFDLEAEAMRRVSGGANVVELFHADVLEDGRRYFVMEWIEGEDLEELLDFRRNQDQRLSVGQACDIGHDIAVGLATVHEHELVHRDLKPANVMVREGDDGERVVKLVDFGIVADLRRSGSKESKGEEVMGTSAYMPPEQAAGAPPATGIDLFALGVVLYEMLTGNCVPPDGWTPESLPKVETLRRGVPRSLANLVRGCMSSDPAGRPTSATWVAEHLAEISRRLSAGENGPPSSEEIPVRTGATEIMSKLDVEALEQSVVRTGGTEVSLTHEQVLSMSGLQPGLGPGGEALGSRPQAETQVASVSKITLESGVQAETQLGLVSQSDPESGGHAETQVGSVSQIVPGPGGRAETQDASASQVTPSPEDGSESEFGPASNSGSRARVKTETQVTPAMKAPPSKVARGETQVASAPQVAQGVGAESEVTSSPKPASSPTARGATEVASSSKIAPDPEIARALGIIPVSRVTPDPEVASASEVAAASGVMPQSGISPVSRGTSDPEGMPSYGMHDSLADMPAANMMASGAVPVPSGVQPGIGAGSPIAWDEEDEAKPKRWWLALVVLVPLLGVGAWVGLGSDGTGEDSSSTATREDKPKGTRVVPPSPVFANPGDRKEAKATEEPGAGAAKETAGLEDEASGGGDTKADTDRPVEPEEQSGSRSGGANKRKKPSKKECEARQSDAKDAKTSRNWSGVLKATARGTCWFGAARKERRRLRVEAFAELGNYAKCVKEGGKSKDSQVAARVKFCKKKLGG